MCLLLALLFLGPRGALLVAWLGWQDRWDRTFDSFLLPLIGFLILPWCTLTYLVVATDGVDGLDIVFLGLAALLDLASLAGSGGYARSRSARV